MTTRRRSGLRSLSRCRSGNAAVEVALLAPVFLLLLAGAVDFGRVFIESIRLASAARAGTQQAYAALADVGVLTGEMEASVRTGVVEAARNAAKDADESLDVTMTINCACPNNPGIPRDCNSSCPSGTEPPMWVGVAVAGQVDLLFGLPGTPNPLGIDESSNLRVR